jgi:hypothetical protein
VAGFVSIPSSNTENTQAMNARYMTQLNLTKDGQLCRGRCIVFRTKAYYLSCVITGWPWMLGQKYGFMAVGPFRFGRNDFIPF